MIRWLADRAFMAAWNFGARDAVPPALRHRGVTIALDERGVALVTARPRKRRRSPGREADAPLPGSTGTF